MLLTNIGFVPNTIQSEETLENLKVLMTFIPLTGVVLSFILVYFYPIDSKFHKKLIKEIHERS
jgi:GPH family glycoside/pentoside/hexuronide:cation symporter